MLQNKLVSTKLTIFPTPLWSLNIWCLCITFKVNSLFILQNWLIILVFFLLHLWTSIPSPCCYHSSSSLHIASHCLHYQQHSRYLSIHLNITTRDSFFKTIFTRLVPCSKTHNSFFPFYAKFKFQPEFQDSR